MSNAVGSYLRNIHNPANDDPINDGARRSLNGQQRFDDSSPRFEDWSPAKQRAAFEGMQRADAKLAANAENANLFLSMHPEFVDSEANGAALNSTLKAMFGDVEHTTEQFERAFEVARANNILELDAAEIAKQTRAATQQRAKTERSRIVYRSEDELETMPLEEIRRLDAIERQKQLQESGERGGSG
jgi:hypothetical protein